MRVDLLAPIIGVLLVNPQWTAAPFTFGLVVGAALAWHGHEFLRLRVVPELVRRGRR